MTKFGLHHWHFQTDFLKLYFTSSSMMLFSCCSNVRSIYFRLICCILSTLSLPICSQPIYYFMLKSSNISLYSLIYFLFVCILIQNIVLNLSLHLLLPLNCQINYFFKNNLFHFSKIILLLELYFFSKFEVIDRQHNKLNLGFLLIILSKNIFC